MKKTEMMGMCLMANALICLATIAYGQQPAAPAEEELFAPAATAPAPAAPAQPEQSLLQQPNQNQQPAAGAAPQAGAADPAPASDEWPMPAGQSLAAPQAQDGSQRPTAGGQRGELGVWLAATGGAGVQIRRVTEGSAADQAGLQPGDVILQINGRGATIPETVSQMIRQMPAGQSANLQIWRNGTTSDMQITLQPLREQYEVGFRGESTSRPSGDLASRTMKLEEQLAMVMRELRQLREEMAQLRRGASSQPTNIGGGIGEAATEPGFESFDQPAAEPAEPATAEPADVAAPPEPFGETGAEPAAEPAAETTEPAAEPAADEDPFGSAATEEAEPAEAEPATEEAAPAATEAEPAEESDSLFE